MFSRLLDFFFPRACLVCGTRLAAEEPYVCMPCYYQLPFEPATDWEYNPHILRNRLDHPSLCRMGALCVYRRDNAAARIVHGVKFHRIPELGLWMGRLAARRLQSTGLFDDVDALVPLPLSPRRQRWRGFNQAEFIARGLADELQLPVRADLLRRTVERESQTHYRLADRFRNGRDLFALAPGAEASGTHLMLVDDVLTTGATMMSAVEQLECFPDIRISTFAWAWVEMTSEVWSRARREALG